MSYRTEGHNVFRNDMYGRVYVVPDKDAGAFDKQHDENPFVVPAVFEQYCVSKKLERKYV